ncbi:hypothetical protein ACI2JN_24045 [Ochrobactrum teleogrylli]|uniref:hypothetical protein n=1 Tax=Ochrobactrum teleogrylli TaxID=2479765 RepID=UPI00384B9370
MKNRTFIAVVIAIALAGINVPVWADGFKIHELTPIKQEFWSIFDASAYHAEEPTNFRMSCCGTDDDQHLMIAIDRHVDEQGQENRTDEGYLKELDVSSEKIGFKIEKIDVSPAIGRLIHLPNVGGLKGVNIFVVEAGDRLTIQSAAPTEEAAENNARKALEIAKKSIIGR